MSRDTDPARPAENYGRSVRVVARIILSVVGIVYVYSFWKILDFTWGLDPPWTGTFLCWGVIATLFVRALGAGGWWLDRSLSVIHFAGAYQLFSNCLPYRTVNEELYLIVAFWCCFIQLNPQKGSRCPAWGPVLLGINLGVYFFTAGMDKVDDPLWSSGEGFARFLGLSWIRHPSADWMLEHAEALRFMNWASIAMELSVLPLMLYWRTRLLACCLLAGFFASLIWPFRMDMIGPVGLGATVLIASSALPGARMQMSGLAWILAFYVGFAGVEVLANNRSSLCRSPGAYSLVSRLHNWAASFDSPSARWLTNNATFFTPKALFSSQHLANIKAFRVQVKTADGTTVEPIRVFNADRTGGVDTQGWGCTRHFQSCMYEISRMSPNGNNGDVPPVVTLLLRYALKKTHGVSATLLLSALDDPQVKWSAVHTYSIPPPPPFPWARLWFLVVELALAVALAWLIRLAWHRGLLRRLAFAKLF
jgi:hypothetical protein